MKPLPIICIFTVCLSWISAALSQAEVQLDSSTLSLQTDDLSLTGIRPRVHVWIGDADEVTIWQPESEAGISRGQEQTPLGPAATTTLSWVSPHGFALAWTITELADRDAVTLHSRLVNTGERDVKIRAFDLLYLAEGEMILYGNPADWMTSTRYLKYANPVGGRHKRNAYSDLYQTIHKPLSFCYIWLEQLFCLNLSHCSEWRAFLQVY